MSISYPFPKNAPGQAARTVLQGNKFSFSQNLPSVWRKFIPPPRGLFPRNLQASVDGAHAVPRLRRRRRWAVRKKSEKFLEPGHRGRPTQSVVYDQPTPLNTLLSRDSSLRLEYILPASLTPHERRPSVRRRGEISLWSDIDGRRRGILPRADSCGRDSGRRGRVPEALVKKNTNVRSQFSRPFDINSRRF